MNEHHQIIEGIVVKGKQLGRTIGFPTANIRPDRWEGEGPNGVYAAWCTVDGQRHPGMLNIGLHPTVPEGAPTVEINLFDFHDDVYGMRATVETVAYLRGEVRFGSVEELRAQLERDRKCSMEILNADAQG
ncbi:MAG: riboflavin kinase [Clostridia bacterium]|nr:riboflavin kinase [Clostridia bacterium]